MDEIFVYFKRFDEHFGKALRRTQAELLAPHGLTARHAPYLLHLAESEEGLSLSELSRAVCFDKANTTRVVHDLEQLGFASRGDGRGCRVLLTNAGRGVAEGLCARVHEIREGLLSALTPEERLALLQIMKKLSERAL